MNGSTGTGDVITIGPVDGPAVLFLHSWWGITPAVHEWAGSLAAAGRRVVIPDTLGGRTVDTEEAAEALLEEIDRDARRTLVERCADELAAQGRPWAAVGFSMGAMYACHVAGRGAAGPEEIYLFYSGGDPEGDVRTKRAQLHYVPDDDFFTADEVKETETALRTAGVDLETFEYPGSRHWFAERGTPGFDEAAFELARTRVLDGLRA